MSKRRGWIIAVAVLLSLCCISSIVIGVIASRSIGAVQGASVACTGQVVAGAPAYRAHASNVVAAFEHNSLGNWTYFQAILPTQWPHAENASDASVVFCFEAEERESLGTCTYEDNSTLTRYRLKRRVRAVEASTARLIREGTVIGDDPESCPDSLRHRGSRSVEREREADEPDAEAMEKAFSDLFR